MTARLLVFIVQFLVVVFGFSQARARLTERQQERELQQYDIVGGSVASADIYPWFTLYANGECAGVLISPSRVLTSASCVQSGHPFSVRVGASNRTNGQEAGVRCAKSHPLYRWPHFPYDIAVLKLEKPVTNVQFALRNRLKDYPSIIDQPLLVAGMGRNQTAGYPANVLTQAQYGFVPESLCKQFFGDQITKGLHICADGVRVGSECLESLGGVLLTLYTLEISLRPLFVHSLCTLSLLWRCGWTFARRCST